MSRRDEIIEDVRKKANAGEFMSLREPFGLIFNAALEEVRKEIAQIAYEDCMGEDDGRVLDEFRILRFLDELQGGKDEKK